VTLLVVVYVGHDDKLGVTADDTGSVIVFSLASLAETFAARLVATGAVLAAGPLTRTPTQLADLAIANDLDADRFRLVEAETVSAADAVTWVGELADRTASRIRDARREEAT
jgi:hypothetical protein